MRRLIPMDESGMFADAHDTARLDSRFVAQEFGKRHADVLRDIEKITDPNSGVSSEFNQRNFALISYVDSMNRRQPAYAMTRIGFTFLVMGYEGVKANQFKEAYIARFDKMEEFIKTVVSARSEFPLLTENINLLHENPKPYHFSNECDLLNSIAVGCNARKFRGLHNIQKGQSIRPYMTPEQIQLLYVIQNVDIGLLVSTPDYYQRKQILQHYANRWLVNHAPLIGTQGRQKERTPCTPSDQRAVQSIQI